MRFVDKFIVHCSATPDGRDVTAAEIDQWHKARGFSGIGYHFVIRLDGSIEFGRPVETMGAHVMGQNSHSIGVCMIGNVDFNTAQFVSLEKLYHFVKLMYPNIKVYGHRDFTDLKTCPNFEVRDYLI